MSKSTVSWRSDATRWNSVRFPKTFRDTLRNSPQYKNKSSFIKVLKNMFQGCKISRSDLTSRVSRASISVREKLQRKKRGRRDRTKSRSTIKISPNVSVLTCPRCLDRHRWVGGAHRREKRSRGSCCRRGRTWIWFAAWEIKPKSLWGGDFFTLIQNLSNRRSNNYNNSNSWKTIAGLSHNSKYSKKEKKYIFCACLLYFYCYL